MSRQSKPSDCDRLARLSGRGSASIVVAVLLMDAIGLGCLLLGGPDPRATGIPSTGPPGMEDRAAVTVAEAGDTSAAAERTRISTRHEPVAGDAGRPDEARAGSECLDPRPIGERRGGLDVAHARTK